SEATMKPRQEHRWPHHRPSRRLRKLVGEFETAHLGVDLDPEFESYNRLYNFAPIAFYTLDRKGCISELNEKGARLLGFSATWLLGRAFVVFVARQDVRRFLDFLTQSLYHPGNSNVIRLDLYVRNRTLPIQISLTSSAGVSVFHRMAVVDASDVRKTEKLLNESTANWYSVMRNAPDTIMTVQEKGRITFVNKPIWGYSVEALVGTNLLDHVPEVEQQKVLRCLNQAFRYNKRIMCDVTKMNDDANRWFNFSFGSPHAESRNRSLITTLMIR